MKYLILTSLAVVFFTSCSNTQATEGGKEQSIITDTSGHEFVLDSTSTLLWDSRKLVGGHNGTIQLKSGSLFLKDGNFISGLLQVNMNSIANNDLTTAEDNKRLVDHLKNKDFFNVADYPEARFELTASEVLSNNPDGKTHKISGNLTIKDSVKNISFPVKVVTDGNELTAEGGTVINRLQWGISYNSVSVSPATLLKKLGDHAIKDELSISFKLKAKK